MKAFTSIIPSFLSASLALCSLQAADILNNPIDVSLDFQQTNHTYFVPHHLDGFDLNSGQGQLNWKRTRLGTNMLFNDMVDFYHDLPANEWPPKMYAAEPALPFSLEFVSANTIRLRLKSSQNTKERAPSLMLVEDFPLGADANANAWKREKVDGGYHFTSSAGSVFLRENPWQLEIRDPSGKQLTQTISDRERQPFSFVRRSNDYSRSFSAVFSLAAGEKIFGAGESFTQLNKRGQKLLLSTTDPLSTERPGMYKPVPFFLSSAGYGMFLHTSAPTTFDFGNTHAARNTLTTGDDEFDLFIFLGPPKTVVEAYTAITGRASMPPLWSFGLWMSRITYWSEAEVRSVAQKLQEHRIPADVIHIDTGWFETEWECDYQFAPSRFDDPKQMIADLADDGFHISLWQLPYFVPGNRLFPEILNKNLAVVDAKGNLPYEDAILDFSNPETVAWYQDKIEGLLRLGVAAIKTDFGEAAPTSGLYASGSTGFYEHNLYPLRYQQAAADITREISGESIIWARAAWAGAQRNPVHWGGDAGKTFSSMAASLRAGLSIGISGFSFWSHDIGGFAGPDNLDVYDKWVPFGMFSSHSRVHGVPPKEPWEFGEAFVDDFRRATEMRYELMPYIYAQAKDCSERGLPMLRALFLEYPEDPGAWLVDDAYLFGSSILVAPILEPNSNSRDVYLPGSGKWIDYQSGKVYSSGWHHIETGKVHAVILVRDGTALPRIALAQSTQALDWSHLELAVFAADATEASALVCLPNSPSLHTLTLEKSGADYALNNNPLSDSVSWKIHSATSAQ